MPGRPPKIVWIAASTVGLGFLLVLGAVVFLVGKAWFGLPVWAQAPDQPIAFPHTIHAGTEEGQLGLDCTFCHRNVTVGAAAVIPSVQQCMFCHQQVKGQAEPAISEIAKLRDAAAAGQPIDWVRVHRLPDHVEFVHEAHIRFFTQQESITPSQVCATCHGDVATMAKVKQVRSLKMGDCVNCHRKYSAPTECATCHY